MPSMSTPQISNALTKKSRFLFANHYSGRATVASVTATTVVLDDGSPFTGLSLYAASTPGMVQIIRGVNAADAGKTANITGFSGSTLTIDEDWSTTPAVADGSLVMVVPPMAFRPKLSGGHSFNANAQNDFTKGLTDTFDTHNTPGVIDPAGGFTAFATTDKSGFVRILAALIGAYKVSGSVHTMVPKESNDGTFAESDDLTVFSSDGNGVSDEVYGALFVSGGTLNLPDSGLPTIAVETQGAAAIREVGGSGKEFPAGANNWDRTGIPCDNDPLFSFTRCFVEFGGSLGDALTDAVDSAVTSASMSVQKGGAAPRPLGNDGYTAKPEETEFTLTWTVTRTYENDTQRNRYWGGSGAPGKKLETRMLVQAFDPSDDTKYAKFDMPRCTIDIHEPQRDAQGLMTESITVRVLHTIDATTDCVDLSVPLVRAIVDNGVSADVLTTLT